MKKRLLILFLLLPFCCKGLIIAQKSMARPKLGLALSGGGSLGMAHVGVLKVMEEAGLRPDYISGVSMGSIVGAMYSIGYSADSLSKLFRTTDWNFILTNNLPENKIIFSEKKYFNNSIMSLPVSSRKVRLPSGLINGQQIEKTLSYFAWPAADIDDFSELPIPFLCLGTDLISTRKVILRTGYLPDAIRASMAVPSIFTPLKIDTAILVDGGFVRNIAVSELKEMGADIIIGSYTGFQRYSENELQSVSGVLKQLSFFNSINDYAEQKKLIDILIEPQVKDLSSTVFTNADSIIERGYRAALPFRTKFKRLADSLNKLGPQQPVEFLLDKDFYAFDRIEIIGNTIITEDQILGILDIKPRDIISKDILSEKIDLLYGRSWFDKVKYRISPARDSLNLVIECTEKPGAMLYGSVHYDNYLNEGLIVNLSVKNPVFPRSLADIESYIGQYFRFRFAHTQFIDRNQKLGLTALFDAHNTPLPVMELRDEKGKMIYRSYSTGFSLNNRTGLNHMMSLSAIYENLNLIPDFIPVNNLNRLSYNFITGSFINQVNTLDTKHFPNTGFLMQVSFNTSKLLAGRIFTDYSRLSYTEGNPDDFLFKRSYSLSVDIRQYFSPGKKVTLTAGGDLLFTYTKDSITSPHNYYFAGGPEIAFTRAIPLTGFHQGEIAVDRFASIKFDLDFELLKDLHLSILTNFAAAMEPGSVRDLSLLGGYGIGLGYMSIIGPLKIGLVQGFSNRERYFNSVKGYISIGFNFYQ